LCNPVMKMKMVFFVIFLVMEGRWDAICRENQSTQGKTCPNATLSTINLTWTDPGSKPGLRGGRPAATRLSHGTALGQRVNNSNQVICSHFHFFLCHRFLRQPKQSPMPNITKSSSISVQMRCQMRII
jgi:hypothetical protein